MTVKKTSVRVVPYDGKGNLLHWTKQNVGIDLADSWGGMTRWLPNEPFTETLKLGNIHTGRSAKYVMWSAEDGRTFPMFVADLVGMVRDSVGLTQGSLSARWMVAKRGQNYGIRLAKEDE